LDNIKKKEIQQNLIQEIISPYNETTLTMDLGN